MSSSIKPNHSKVHICRSILCFEATDGHHLAYHVARPCSKRGGGVPNMGPRSVNGEIFTFAVRNGEFILHFHVGCPFLGIVWWKIRKLWVKYYLLNPFKPSNPSKCKSSAFVGLHIEFHEVNSQDAFGSFWNVEASMRIVYVYWLEYWIILHLQKNATRITVPSPYPTWGSLENHQLKSTFLRGSPEEGKSIRI